VVETAKTALATAEKALSDAEKVSPPVPADIATAKAVVATAKEKLEDAKKAVFGPDTRKEAANMAKAFADTARGKIPNQNAYVLTNFGVARMTSSQFHNFSGYRPGKPGADGAPDPNSRLGLPLGDAGGRYVVGGWCVGQVTDSAAARATHDGVVVGTSGKAKSAHAANILVSCEWWSGDKLYRKFMNRPMQGSATQQAVPGVRSRFEVKRQAPLDPFALPASKRPAP
jgi:hypothetical protein